MTIQMKSVFSTMVKRIGYDDATFTLIVEWNNGKTSGYANVPIDTYEQLLKAPSIGAMIHTDIKPNFKHIGYLSLPS